jgi:hypothetical protein
MPCSAEPDADGRAWSALRPQTREERPFGADIASMPVRAWLAHIWMFGAAISMGRPTGHVASVTFCSVEISGRSHDRQADG